MRLTVVGVGRRLRLRRAWQPCFWLETAEATLLVDCGASALPARKDFGLDPNWTEAIVLSHLHGDHFGGLPFLLLDGQFLSRRERELVIFGPPGTRERLDALLEVFFPRSTGSKWRFPWRVEEVAVGVETGVLGHRLGTAEVIHKAGAPSTALRLSDGEKTFAYSGDTEWTDALLPIARDADLFICECYADEGAKISGHMSWEVLRPKITAVGMRRIMLTHMNPSMLAELDALKGEGLLLAETVCGSNFEILWPAAR